MTILPFPAAPVYNENENFYVNTAVGIPKQTGHQAGSAYSGKKTA
jgi:hypothetical protein